MWGIFSRDPASSFPYEILDEISNKSNKSLWKIHRGRKKQNGDEVTIFVCDKAPEQELDIARTSIKKLKSLRHPCILTYVDSVENDKLVYLATEPVTPLKQWLDENELSSSHRENSAAWGLFQIAKGLSFLNNDAKMTHFNINIFSIFVTRGGEWKIGGMEYISADNSHFPHHYPHYLNCYSPPEKANPSKGKVNTTWSADIWGYGCLLWEVFNGPLDQSMSLQNTSKIPKNLLPTYCELVGANPVQRPNPQDVLEKLRQKGQFFNNDLIQTLLFLEEIQIKDEGEKHRFLSELSKKLDNIPDFVCKNKILPAVLQAHEFSNVGSVVLTPLFKIGKLLDEQEYQKQILPCVVKLFSSSDRATRLKLLQQIDSFVEHMDSKMVNEQVYPQLSSGFLDSNPTIREHTVKAIFFLAPKLNENNLNIEVLKHFARLQAKDELGGIRTNTTVCLGKIASYLNPSTRQKCLVSAFSRAMRDPFPPQRVAGATALAATQQYYPLKDVSTKVLPVLCSLTMDPEKEVRDSVFKVLKGFLSKLEKVSEDPTLMETMESEVMTTTTPNSQVAAWAGWAVGAVTSKFYKGPPQPQKPTPNTTPTNSKQSSIDESMSKMNIEHKNSINNKDNNEDLLSSLNDNDSWRDSSATKLSHNYNNEKSSCSLSETLSSMNNELTSDGWDEEAWEGIEDTTINNEEILPKTNNTDSWDTWDNTPDPGFAATKSVSSKNDTIREREQKKIQRQKEIEAKRQARAGPMKLGAKKLQL